MDAIHDACGRAPELLCRQSRCAIPRRYLTIDKPNEHVSGLRPIISSSEACRAMATAMEACTTGRRIEASMIFAFGRLKDTLVRNCMLPSVVSRTSFHVQPVAIGLGLDCIRSGDCFLWSDSCLTRYLQIPLSILSGAISKATCSITRSVSRASTIFHNGHIHLLICMLVVRSVTGRMRTERLRIREGFPPDKAANATVFGNSLERARGCPQILSDATLSESKRVVNESKGVQQHGLYSNSIATILG